MALTTTGFAAVDDILAAGKVVQMEDAILNNLPDAAPFLSLTNRLGRVRDVENPEFKWLVDEPAPVVITIATNYVGGTDDVIEVPAGQGKYFEPHMGFLGSNGIQYRTDHVHYGTGTGGADVVDFAATGGHDSPADLQADGVTPTVLSASHNMTAAVGTLLLTGVDQAEKADAEEGWTDEPTEVSNYIQNFYAAVSIGDMADKTKLYGGKRRVHDHAKRQFEIARMIEFAYYLGKKAKFASSAEGNVYMLGGFNEAISTNAISLSAAVLTEDLMLSKMPQITEYASADKLAFVGSSKFVNKFATFGSGKLQVRPEDKTWGFAPTKWLSPYGEVPIIRSRSLDSYASGLVFFCIAYDELKKVLFTDGGIKMLPNRQTTLQYQKILDIYTSRHSLQWGRQKFHSKVYNWAVS